MTHTTAPCESLEHSPRILRPRVAIIGGGPSGLTAAKNLAGRVQGEVLVFEREKVAGGIPRHSDHPGYGMRDMRRFISGPRYASILRQEAATAGAVIHTESTVTDWTGERSFNVTSPTGRLRVEADAIILATGARERPRPARLIPGDRGGGVYTTGHLQNVVHLKHGRVGRRAVIVGAELVSWSAALTLRHVGCKTALMTTEYTKPDSYFFFTGPGRLFFRTRIETRTKVTRIIGRPVVKAVEIENLDTGIRRIVPCDTVILTGDWVPDNELARAAGAIIDPKTRGPRVDGSMRTSLPGVFAIGNALHPVDTADIAALEGRSVAGPVLDYLAGKTPPPGEVDIHVAEPLRWVSPSVVRPTDTSPPRGRLELWTDEFITFPKVVVRQGSKVVASRRLPWPAAPGRVFRIPSSLLRNIRSGRGSVTISIHR